MHIRDLAVTDLAWSFLGLGNGATFAALGLAIVLVYQSSGVINFATRRTGGCRTYVPAAESSSFIPFLHLGVDETTRDQPGRTFSPTEALVITLLISDWSGPCCTCCSGRCATPQLAKAVASLSVLVILQTAMSSRMAQPAATAIYPTDTWSWQGVNIPSDRGTSPSRSWCSRWRSPRSTAGPGSGSTRAVAESRPRLRMDIAGPDHAVELILAGGVMSSRHPDRTALAVDPVHVHALRRPGVGRGHRR
jgi:hypothetical protein